MKKFLLLFVAACFGMLASAQKVYFLYFQTEDQSPFYIRMGDKVYSSAVSGFLILPNLTDTTYYFNIGFAKNSEPETKFSIAVNQTDRGFLIKKFDDGVALFDFEELSVVKSTAAQKDSTVYETKSDAFSNVLSKAAGDPSIIKIPVAKKEEEKPKPEAREEVTAKVEEKKPIESPVGEDSSTTQNEVVKDLKPSFDSTLTKNKDKVDTVAQLPAGETTVLQQPSIKTEDSTAAATPHKPSVISRHSESSTTEGFGIVYFDKSEERTDTVRILIPLWKVKLTSESDTSSSTDLQTNNDKIDSVIQTTKKEIDTKEAGTSPQVSTENKAVCKNTATEKDFLKLRKKMAAEETDEAMINEAKKDFRNRCYNVEQLRYLSTLFLTSSAKYQFFDAAYEHVADKANFASLGSEIKDDYYVKRFEALVGE